LAVDIHATYRHKGGTLLSGQAAFRRKRGKIETKKIHRKIKLKIKHIIISFLMLVGFFYGFSRLYLFLITWEKLNIREIEISCQKEDVRQDIKRFLSRKYLGNILLLDIKRLQVQLAAHQWIKDVHIRKIFPSAIRIETQERIPVAVLVKEKYFLVDKEGILLQEISPGDRPDLPLLTDINRFQRDFDLKLALAWDCLESLGEAERKQVSVMDLSEYENVSIRLKDSEIWLKLGNERFYEKLQIFRDNSVLFQKYGPLEYIDFRFEDRLVLRPHPLSTRMNTPDSEKEAF
jgi:cell division septal protein FtsQ